MYKTSILKLQHFTSYFEQIYDVCILNLFAYSKCTFKVNKFLKILSTFLHKMYWYLAKLRSLGYFANTNNRTPSYLIAFQIIKLELQHTSCKTTSRSKVNEMSKGLHL